MKRGFSQTLQMLELKLNLIFAKLWGIECLIPDDLGDRGTLESRKASFESVVRLRFSELGSIGENAVGDEELDDGRIGDVLPILPGSVANRRRI